MTSCNIRLQPAQSLQEADPRQVQTWLQNGEAVLIDVREPDEYAREHIAGSTLIPLARFGHQQAAAIAPPGKKIVIHCKSGSRAADACRRVASLAASGQPIYSLAGGIEGWKQAKLPVTLDTSVSALSVMRQVQLVIGLCVLAGCALAWFKDPRFVAIPAFFGAGLTFAGATGTCALATVLSWMPWNKAATGGKSCTSDSCCG